MTRWPQVPIGSVMAGFFDGPHATPAPADDGPIYLGIKNITEDGHLDLNQLRHISWEDFPRWIRRVEPRPGDLVFTYEASLHRYAIIPDGFKGCLGRRTALIQPDTELIDGRFLLYQFLGPQWRGEITKRLNIGSTVDRVPLIDFPLFPIQLPPLWEQRRIAAVLAAYDELIENNLRRIEILEEMAQAVYREWFVNFRFPGHEVVPLVDSPIGPMPDGWTVSDLGASAQWLSGGTPKTSEPSYWGGVVPWITSGSLTSFLLDRSDRTLTEQGVEAGSRLVPRDTLLFVVRGMSLATEFRHGIAEVPLAFGQDCKALIAQPPLDPLYLAYSVSARASEIQGMVEYAAHGTGKLSTDRLKGLRLLHPPGAVQQAFADLVVPMRRLMANLRQQVDNLRATRDLLLPRLMSGQIDVSELDIDTEWLAS